MGFHEEWVCLKSTEPRPRSLLGPAEFARRADERWEIAASKVTETCRFGAGRKPVASSGESGAPWGKTPGPGLPGEYAVEHFGHLHILTFSVIMRRMIKSFRCKETEQLFRLNSVRRFRAIEGAARRKLEFLEAAISLTDLRNPPGNRLEALSGDRKGQYSIRINDQWRLCFEWDEGAENVEIVDYHR